MMSLDTHKGVGHNGEPFVSVTATAEKQITRTAVTLIFVSLPCTTPMRFCHMIDIDTQSKKDIKENIHQGHT